MKQADRKAVKMKREESRLRQSTSTAQGEQQQGVSNATRERVEQSCRNAGLSSWQAVVTACQCGAVFRVGFSSRRPVDFVKEFSCLVRNNLLAFGADNTLQLHLGTATSLQRLADRDRSERDGDIGEITELGALDDAEAQILLLSPEARGTRFTVQKRLDTEATKARSILILDDEPVARQVLGAILKKEGHVVSAVGEAEAAFALIRQNPPDLIVLDIVLGGNIDGLEFCEMLRGSVAYEQIPVVFVTGHADDAFVQRCSEVTNSVCLRKPVRTVPMREAITMSFKQPR
jgi:CheY-like chemotaxis protein